MVDQDVPQGNGLFVVLVLLEASLAPLALAIGWLISEPPLAHFAWNARDAALGALATIPLLGLLLVTLYRPIGPLRRIKQICEEELAPLLGRCTWHDLALVALAAGVGEELLFRGVIQGALGRAFGPWMGLAIAAPLFGLAHPITPAYAVITSVIGYYLGAIWIINGNLLTVVVAHALYDFIALLILVRPRPFELSGEDGG